MTDTAKRERSPLECEGTSAEISRLRKENEQYAARLHCMCGSPVDHSAWDGHSPVSMYDHALDQVTQERDRFKAALMWAFDRLSIAVGRGADGMTVKEQRDTHREIGHALLGRSSRATKHRPNDWDPSAELGRGNSQ